jgi:hypothetical protein
MSNTGRSRVRRSAAQAAEPTAHRLEVVVVPLCSPLHQGMNDSRLAMIFAVRKYSNRCRTTSGLSIQSSAAEGSPGRCICPAAFEHFKNRLELELLSDRALAVTSRTGQF